MVDDYLVTIGVCELTAVLFYLGVGIVKRQVNKLPRYAGFGVLIGFISFVIVLMLSARFGLAPALSLVVSVASCAVFVGSPMFESFLKRAR